MKQGRKRRKFGNERGCFAGLIDISIPLWEDIFSVVFQYCGDFVLNRLMRSSKPFFELVKERALFSFPIPADAKNLVNDFQYLQNVVKLLRTFYFSTFMFYGSVPFENLLRQRFLSYVLLFPFSNVDLTSFCRCNEAGRPYFPRLENICISAKGDEHLDKFNLWEFLRKRKADQNRIGLSVFQDVFDVTEECLQRLVKEGIYSKFSHVNLFPYLVKRRCDHILNDQEVQTDISFFGELDTKCFRIDSVGYHLCGVVGQFLCKLRKNRTLEKLHLSSCSNMSPRQKSVLYDAMDSTFEIQVKEFSDFIDCFLEQRNFVNVKTLEFSVTIDVFVKLCPFICRILLSEKKETVQKVLVYNRAVGDIDFTSRFEPCMKKLKEAEKFEYVEIRRSMGEIVYVYGFEMRRIKRT